MIKFNLPSDYPDELIDNHITVIKYNFNISKEKIKQILKINSSTSSVTERKNEK